MLRTQLNITTETKLIRQAWEIQLNAEEAREGFYYLPSNSCEVFLVLKGSLTRELVGTNRKSNLYSGKGYFGLVRPRAMCLRSDEDVTFILLQIDSSVGFSFCSKIDEGERKILWPLEELLVDSSDHWCFGNIKALAESLNKHLKAPSSIGIVDSSLELIKSSRGKIKVKDLNDQLGICKSTLEEKFSQMIGLSPKEVCKIEKLNFFLSNYNKYSDLSLTELTFKSGYYDQSHLIKDFKYFADLSPRKYLKQTKRLDSVIV